jgi:aminopeptidase 2
LRALGRFEDKELIERTLTYLLDGTVLNQDFYIPMQGIRVHKKGIERLWAWMQEHWDEIAKRLQPGSPVLGGVLTLGLTNFTSFEALEKISAFYSRKVTKGFDQTLAQALDTIRSKAQWVSRDREIVATYLREHEYDQ